MTMVQYMNSFFAVPQYVDFILRLVMACIAGFILGYNPRVNIKGVGTRTYIMTCCAAALIMIISKYGFADLVSSSGQAYSGTRGADAARVAAQAVSGISFLCAGIIFKSEGGTVKGLTTAAGMWLTVAVGLGIGAGMIVVTFATVVVSTLMRLIYGILPVGTDNYAVQHVVFNVSDGKTFHGILEQQFEEWKIKRVGNMKESLNPDGSATFEMNLFRKTKLTFKELDLFTEKNKIIQSFSIEVLG